MTTDLKLYMLLLGGKPPGRHIEQHDFLFAIATSLKELVPDIKAFWPQAGDKLHIDAWREVKVVDGYRINIVPANSPQLNTSKNLFFINLGGYLPNLFEEQHYTILTVQDTPADAFKKAKQTDFFKNNQFDDATSHIDNKYGVDVDDMYQIEDILVPAHKELYKIQLLEEPNLPQDEIHLGYFKLNNL